MLPIQDYKLVLTIDITSQGFVTFQTKKTLSKQTNHKFDLHEFIKNRYAQVFLNMEEFFPFRHKLAK